MEFSRRRFLGGAATACVVAAGWPVVVEAPREPQPKLLGGRMRPAPRLPKLEDIARLMREGRCVSGVRPHRVGGIKLALERHDVGGGVKFLVHNYGHSGVGITLSWGCAAKVVEHVRTAVAALPATATNRIAVLGSGVIGLTSARELRCAFPWADIRIYTANYDGSRVAFEGTCSWVAGGQIEPSVISNEYEGHSPETQIGVLNGYMSASVRKIRALREAGMWDAYGIAPRLNFMPMTMMNTGFERVKPTEDFWRPEYGALPFRNLNNAQRCVRGALYQTWLMNPRIMLPRLVRELEARHVTFHRRTFASEFDVLSLEESIIVNCTGLGARAIFNDANMKPIKGQLMVLPNPSGLDYFFSGGCGPQRSAYVFCRQNDVVLGGSYEENVDSEGATEAECAKFLARLRLLFVEDPLKCGPYVESYRAES